MLEGVLCRERLLPPGSLRCGQRNTSIPQPQSDLSWMLALICHDLRLPLTAILANAEFLTASDIDETERKDLYQVISSAVGWMNEMITSLLDTSRNAETLRLAVQNVAATVERVIAMTSVRLTAPADPARRAARRRRD